MIRSAELHTEHVADDGTLEPIIWIENAGYPVDVVKEYPSVSVKDGEDNTGYRVTKIRTFSKHPEEADAVEDEIELLVCHCWNFVTEHLPDFSEGATPDEIGKCKHCRANDDKSERAKEDENQQTFATPVGDK